MVFKIKNKEEPVIASEDNTEEVEEVSEEAEEEQEETAEPKMIGYPVFITPTDVNRMVFENNQMLKSITEELNSQEE